MISHRINAHDNAVTVMCLLNRARDTGDCATSARTSNENVDLARRRVLRSRRCGRYGRDNLRTSGELMCKRIVRLPNVKRQHVCGTAAPKTYIAVLVKNYSARDFPLQLKRDSCDR